MRRSKDREKGVEGGPEGKGFPKKKFGRRRLALLRKEGGGGGPERRGGEN